MLRNLPLLSALVLTLIGFLLMVGFEQSGADTYSSQLQLQFAWTAERTRAVLASWGEAGRDRVSNGIYADYLFLIGYGALLAQLLRATRREWGRRLAWGALLAAGLDAMENVFLLGFIQETIDVRFTLLVSLIASVKFGLIGAALLHLGTHLARPGKRA
ncbi:MAG: hypothetical protein PHD37_04865 [Gallionellaceae bacterium]|nr:hypothetical protein [Gallionellaceae bacterium]